MPASSLVTLLASLVLTLPGGVAVAQSPGGSPTAVRPVTHTRYVYLIRHGAYDPDSTAVDDTRGNGLNALGHEQARLTAARLAALPVPIDRFVSSTYLRAAQTADDIGAILHRAPERDSLLHECTPDSDRPDINASATDAERAACTANLEAAWAKYMQPSRDADAHDVLICHGNVIRWFVTRALQIDSRKWLHFTIGNCSITALVVAPDGSVRVAAYSDTGHLPVEKQSWTGAGAGWLTPKK